MVLLNENYFKLKAGYLFPEIGRRVKAFGDANPDAAKRIIRCGIGDVTEPLPQAVIAALHLAVDEMSARESFRGYGPEQGYEFLRHAIAENDFRAKGLEIADDEIFVSDGSKCDCGNILDILGARNRIGITDPVYPVYVDTNVMAGHTGEADESGAFAGITYLPCTAKNGFVPEPPGVALDLIYLCFPNNPTGAVATRAQLAAWVDYALTHRALILFDAAYEAYISDPAISHSIYEIKGARECAIEFRSFSKSGGFTGTRCAFTVVPKTVLAATAAGEWQPLHPLWNRRMSTKFNGVSYIVQRAAEALYTPEGKAQVAALIEHYMGNAKILREATAAVRWHVHGGVNAPYIWVGTPTGMTSWQMFDRMLSEANVVITPGSGFGAMGEGWFRISAFNSRVNVEEVARRIQAIDWGAMIEAKFPFDADVLREAFDVHRGVRRWTKWLRFFSWVACAIGLWLLIKEQRHIVGGTVLGLGLLMLVWPRIQRALWLKVISDHPFFGQEVSCQFDTGGFLLAAKGQGIKVAWEDTFKIVEGDRGYLIYPKSGAFYYIPARGFATDIDAERVKGLFLSEKMRRT